MITVRELASPDDPFFDEWYAAYRTGETADREAAIVASHESLSYSLRTPSPIQAQHLVAAFDGDRVVGGMLFRYRLQDSPDIVEVKIAVPPAERRRGVGTALWNWARAKAAAIGRTVFQCDYAGNTSPGAAFAAALGFTVEHVEDHLVLPLPYAGELEPAPPAGFELVSWAGPCPEQHLEAFADLRTRMDRALPSGGLTKDSKPWQVDVLRALEERVDKLYLSVLTMAISADGRPAGYTVLYLPRTDPDTALQFDTFVLPDFRGHDLGAHLKLANLALLARTRTTQKWLHTFTAKSNTAMQKINTRFGFRPVEDKITCELTVEQPRLRPAARGVVLDVQGRILLLRFEFDDKVVWAAPGGGVEAGETTYEGLVRELREEIGLEVPADPQHVWHQVAVGNGFARGYDGVAAENVYGHHWWSLDELQAHQGPALLSPRSLPYLLSGLLTQGPPSEPLFLGV
jgi:ADP-ribose pyrophosphatase YjhB (NUDIX family)/GNAT superfamily N-acetyltransferase